MNEMFDELLSNPTSSFDFAETFLTDAMDQLNIIDPSEETQELISLIANLVETKSGQDFLAYLVGVPDFIEYTLELECIQNLDGGYTPSRFPSEDQPEEFTMFDDEQGQEN
jgi:hypothetical protein